LEGKKKNKESKPRRPGRCMQMPRLGKMKIKESCEEREIGECKINVKRKREKERKKKKRKRKREKKEANYRSTKKSITIFLTPSVAHKNIWNLRNLQRISAETLLYSLSAEVHVYPIPVIQKRIGSVRSKERHVQIFPRLGNLASIVPLGNVYGVGTPNI
jgi:hypothetical protein